MTTVQKLQAAVKRLRQTYITKAKSRRFLTGVTQLSLREFNSLNAAGRHIGLNRFTSENRIRRTITDSRLADQIQSLLRYWSPKPSGTEMGICIVPWITLSSVPSVLPCWQYPWDYKLPIV